MLAKRARMKVKRRVTIKEEHASSSSSVKLDTLVIAKEKMVETIYIIDRTFPKENQGGSQIINSNLRKGQPQTKQQG